MLSTYYIIITAAEVQMSKTHSFDAIEYLLEVESTYFKLKVTQNMLLNRAQRSRQFELGLLLSSTYNVLYSSTKDVSFNLGLSYYPLSP